MLKEDRHEAGDDDDREKGVIELRASSQIGRPVAGIHVANRDQVPRAGKGKEFTKKSQPTGAGCWDGDCAEGFLQRWSPELAPPPGINPGLFVGTERVVHGDFEVLGILDKVRQAYIK